MFGFQKTKTCQKRFIYLGIVLAGFAVILGAFGAHALSAVLDAKSLEVYKTAVDYQMLHGFVLIMLGLAQNVFSDKESQAFFNYAGWSFVIGILCFSGSLHVLIFRECSVIAAIPGFPLLTPLGGLVFIIGWAMFFIAVQKSQAKRTL